MYIYKVFKMPPYRVYCYNKTAKQRLSAILKGNCATQINNPKVLSKECMDCQNDSHYFSLTAFEREF